MSWFIRRKNNKKRLTAADAKPFTRPPEYLRRRESTAKSKPDTRPRILVVDDEYALVTVYIRFLREHGFKAYCACDGEEALDVAVRLRPDLIVTDIMMPRISGFDVIDILKSTPELKDIPVIILCALDSQEDIDRGLRLGAAEYLVNKNTSLDDLVNAIKRVLKKSKKTNSQG
jgi:DNA-binding response OmpR family regulator